MEIAQEVVMIQDSAAKPSVSFMKWAIKGLPFRAGDRLTLVSVLHQLNTPLGYVRVDSCSLIGANPRIIELEAAKLQKLYENHAGLLEISQLYQNRKIEFNIEVATGPSRRIVGVEAAKKLNASLVILDRQMKNETSYFVENLSCGIWRIKQNCKIEQLRAPNRTRLGANNGDDGSGSGKISSSLIINRPHTKTPISDDEISSSTSTAENDQDLFSIEL